MEITHTIMLDIEDSVRCIICYEFLLDKILLCKKGHSVCEKCVTEKQVAQCPQCPAALTDSRNYQLEQLIDRIKSHFTVRCSFDCSLKVKLSEIDGHQMECEHRLVPCELGKFYGNGCEWKGKILEIPSHRVNCMESNYYFMDTNVQDGSPSEFITRFHCRLPCPKKIAVLIADINGDNKVFYFKFVKINLDGYNMAIQHVGSKDKAMQFWYSVTVKKGCYGMSVNENCESDVKDFSSIVDEGRSIYYPSSYLNKVTKKDCVRFNIIIKRIGNF